MKNCQDPLSIESEQVNILLKLATLLGMNFSMLTAPSGFHIPLSIWRLLVLTSSAEYTVSSRVRTELLKYSSGTFLPSF